MAIGLGPPTKHRGTLLPAPAFEDALKCEICGGWFMPSADNFGCPWCAQNRDLSVWFCRLPAQREADSKPDDPLSKPDNPQ